MRLIVDFIYKNLFLAIVGLSVVLIFIGFSSLKLNTADASLYLSTAENIANHHGLTVTDDLYQMTRAHHFPLLSYYQPLYPIFISLFINHGGIVRIIQINILLFALNVVLILYLLQLLMPTRFNVLFALLLALSSHFYIPALYAWTEQFYFFGLLLTIIIFLRFKDIAVVLFCLGIFNALLMLIRVAHLYNFLAFLPILFIGKDSFQQKFRRASFLMGGFILAYGFYEAFCYSKYHAFYPQCPQAAVSYGLARFSDSIIYEPSKVGIQLFPGPLLSLSHVKLIIQHFRDFLHQLPFLSWLPFFYFLLPNHKRMDRGMVFTDMIFSVFILGAFTMFVWAFTDRPRRGAAWMGFYICCALATLTKGPLGFVIPQVSIILFLLYQRQLDSLKNMWVPLGILLFLLIALPWYLYTYHQYGHAFTHEFFYNDHWRRLLSAEHHGNDHWFFYPVTMIAGLFPWSLFLMAAVVDLFKRLKSSVTLVDYLSLSWIITVFVVFQMAHSKLASYILPLFPALALLTGNFLGNGLSQIQQRQKMRKLLSSSFLILAMLGIAVIGAQKVFKHYLPSTAPIYFLSGSLVALAGIGASLAFKDRLQGAVYVLALSLCPILLTAFMIRTNIEGYVSSYEASGYIPQRSVEKMTVLTSKANARGIRYYTGQDVAVVDFSGKPFFSPHPIPILDTDEKIKVLLKNQRLTIGVVRKSTYQDILKNLSKDFHVSLLRIIGYDYVIRVTALTH